MHIMSINAEWLSPGPPPRPLASEHLGDVDRHFAQGTLTSISGTAAYVCAVAVLAPTLGILMSAGIGLAALPVANAIVKRLGSQEATPPRGRADDVIRPVMS